VNSKLIKLKYEITKITIKCSFAKVIQYNISKQANNTKCIILVESYNCFETEIIVIKLYAISHPPKNVLKWFSL